MTPEETAAANRRAHRFTMMTELPNWDDDHPAYKMILMLAPDYLTSAAAQMHLVRALQVKGYDVHFVGVREVPQATFSGWVCIEKGISWTEETLLAAFAQLPEGQADAE